MELYRAVFGEEGALKRGYPDYIYPVNILHDAGIYPDVRIYHAVWESVYDSVEEAARNWVTMHIHGEEDTSPVFEHFAKVLKKDASGRYVDTSLRPTAAIWWTKEEKKKG
jgi:hypothetical protein